MKDRNGTKLEIGDTVHCNGLEFTIESFKTINNSTLACGDYGDFNVDLLELVSCGGD